MLLLCLELLCPENYVERTRAGCGTMERGRTLRWAGHVMNNLNQFATRSDLQPGGSCFQIIEQHRTTRTIAHPLERFSKMLFPTTGTLQVRAMGLWRCLDETFPDPSFSLCVPPHGREKVASRSRSKRCVTLRIIR